MSVKDLLDLIHLSPDYDVLSKKAALQQLSLVLETNVNDFVEFRGFDIIFDQMSKGLDEMNNSLELLPFALETFKVACVHCPNFIQQLRVEKEKYLQLLYILARSLYMYHDLPNVLEQVIVSMILILFHDWLKHDLPHLQMAKFMINKLNFPIEVHEEKCDDKYAAPINDTPAEAFLLLKIYWNLAWFGGIHILNQWTSPKGDTQFSPKLYLETSDLSLVKNSFSSAIVEDLVSCMFKESKTHGDFQDALQLARSHYKLLCDPVPKLSWSSTFSRFLRLKPNTRNDEKLFLAIIEFLTDHVEPVDEVFEEGRENLLQFLVRNRPVSGMDLLLKGQEKVSKFILKTGNIQSSENSIWDENLNHWSIKILATIKPKLNKFKLNQLYGILLGHKPHLFTGSSKVFFSLIILDEFLSMAPNSIESLDWLQKIVVNRDASIRTLGFQIIATLASSIDGALLLTTSNQNSIWNQLIDVVLDGSECCQARENAMIALTNLLKLSVNKNTVWFGPIMKVAGIKLTGEASMASFFVSVQFEETLSRLYKSFSQKHCNTLSSNTITEESIRQTSVTSNSIQDESEILEDPTNASFIASTLAFLVQIIKMDTVII